VIGLDDSFLGSTASRLASNTLMRNAEWPNRSKSSNAVLRCMVACCPLRVRHPPDSPTLTTCRLFVMLRDRCDSPLTHHEVHESLLIAVAGGHVRQGPCRTRSEPAAVAGLHFCQSACSTMFIGAPGLGKRWSCQLFPQMIGVARQPRDPSQ